MRINKAIRELWKKGFFENHKRVSEIKHKVKVDYGMNPSNIIMNLKSCKEILRKEKNGWIQKIRFSFKTYAEESETPKSLELYDVTNDAKLIKACKSNYEAENYWDTVFNASRHMEVRVRKKSGLSASEFGADLMERAFKPSVGPLKIPCCETPGEEDGFKMVTKGMMMFHRNAKGHREEFIDKILALKIIGYIDYLLQIIDTAEIRNT